MLWLHTWHDQSDPVTDERPWSCTYRTSYASQTLYQLLQSSSPAGKGVMDTSCTLENTQIYTSCGKESISPDTKTLLRNPELSPTHRTQMCGGHTIARGLGHTTEPAVLRKCCLSQSDTSCPESNQPGMSRELALSGSRDVPQLQHCGSKANTQQRRCNPTVTPQSSFKCRFSF